jgi:ABC-type branched-subunit amino acid transport system substrate-binding protein
MRRTVLILAMLALACPMRAQTFKGCDCGKNPPGRPAERSMKPYAQEPDDLQPFSKFTQPYYQHYVDLVEYNGAARDIPLVQAKDVSEVRIGFIGPLENHPDAALGKKMLNGAQMAIDEANAAGGYGGKPFKLMLHNDSAIWGAASNELVKMVYDDQDWAMFGSISGDTTHIALRVSLKAELPIVNSASTDPTIVETIIPWYFSVLQDDRTQGYTLARHIYTELGLKRVALLRVNDRYGRFGVGKFRDASRRLGHPVVIEQKFLPYETDFARQLKVIQESRVDGIVLWTDEPKAAMILKQMRDMGMKQPVFGSHRTLGMDLVKLAGPAAEGFQAVYPYNPTSTDPAWLQFQARYEARYHQQPDHFSALAYDQMNILLQAICRAGLNRGMIRDALYSTLTYDGVTGAMQFDPNDKQLREMYLGTVHDGRIDYRKLSMQKEYARVGEDGVLFAGPPTSDAPSSTLKVAIFGPSADKLVHTASIPSSDGRRWELIGVSSDVPWGKASDELVRAVYDQNVIAMIAVDRASSHLAEQIGVKAFVPVIAISSDHALTSSNIPWIFRVPEGTSLDQALKTLAAAEKKSGANRSKLRDALASGAEFAGVTFQPTGEPGR